MLKTGDRLSYRQLGSITYVMLLAPVIRPLPDIIMGVSGRTSWITTLLAIIPLSIMALFMGALMKKKAPGEGLGEIIVKVLGINLGKGLLFFYGIWFLFFVSQLFKAGADRFVDTVYPESEPWIFAVLMLTLVAYVSHGKKKSLGRLSEVFRPILTATFIIVIIFSLPLVEFKNLLPISSLDIKPVLRGVYPVTNIMGVFVYLAFLEGFTEPSSEAPQGRSHYIKSIIKTLLIISALLIEVVGAYGLELSSKMNNPFFNLVRDIKILDTLEHIEAIIVCIWVLTDFMLGTVLLTMAIDLLSWVFNIKNRLILTIACFALEVFIISLSATDSFLTNTIITTLVPALNALFIFCVLPIVFIIGKIRKKI